MNSRQTDILLAKVEAGFAGLGLLDTAAPVVLMVSGGSDSVALARLAASIFAERAQLLAILHVNHQLRGTDSDQDERFVEHLGTELDIACKTKRVDVAAAAVQAKESLEQAGRRLRYALAAEFLDELCLAADRAPKLGRIATAHTANDRAETLLQRLIVGGGGGSLASIQAQNGRIVRPLLDCSRAELQNWLNAQQPQQPQQPQQQSANGELWREDASNLDTTLSRAFVRHKLLPLLQQRNPRIIAGLNRTATVLGDESAWLDEQASALLPLGKAAWSAPLPLLRRAIYLACNEAIAGLSPEARITFEHIEQIAKEGMRPGFATQIPGGIEVRNVRGQFTFQKAQPPRHNHS